MLNKVLPFLATTLILSCGSDESSRLSGMYSSAYLVWSDGKVPVCLKGFSSSQSKTIQNALQEFAKSTDKIQIDFLSAEKCNPRITDVLGIYKREDFVGMHGWYMLQSRAIQLFTDYAKTKLLNCGTPESKKICLWNMVRHEFGHAMGMAHEAKHPQSKCSMSRVSNPSNTTEYGSYDPKSIMNHCYFYNSRFGNEKIKLSEGDIKMLDFLYDSKEN